MREQLLTDRQTDRQTDTQNDYCNPRCACAPRVNDSRAEYILYADGFFIFYLYTPRHKVKSHAENLNCAFYKWVVYYGHKILFLSVNIYCSVLQAIIIITYTVPGLRPSWAPDISRLVACSPRIVVDTHTDTHTDTHRHTERLLLPSLRMRAEG